MKKTIYLAPSMKVYVMEAESMICASTGFEIGGSSQGDDPFADANEADERGKGTYEW